MSPNLVLTGEQITTIRERFPDQAVEIVPLTKDRQYGAPLTTWIVAVSSSATDADNLLVVHASGRVSTTVNGEPEDSE